VLIALKNARHVVNKRNNVIVARTVLSYLDKVNASQGVHKILRLI